MALFSTPSKIVVILMLLFAFEAMAQPPFPDDLFRSVEEQQTTLLLKYIRSDGDLSITNPEGKGLVEIAVDHWNVPAVSLLLENNAPFRYSRIKQILREKVKTHESLQITPENYKAHDKQVDYIEPFEEYIIHDNKQIIEHFKPVLAPPSYNELKQVFNKSKLQVEILGYRTVNSGFDRSFDLSGYSVGGGLVLPLVRNYSSEVKCGERNINVSKSSEGNRIYFDEEVYQVEQLDIQQSLKQKFSVYLQVLASYSKRMTGVVPDDPGLYTDITTDSYYLDFRSLDISPALLFKIGSFYAKGGMEFRKHLEASLLYPANAAEEDRLTEEIPDEWMPMSTAILFGLGLDFQFAYIEFDRTFFPSDIREDLAGGINWMGISLGLRL